MELLFAAYCPVNTSKSKQLYSFPKQRRFKPPKKLLSTSFGVGDRFKMIELKSKRKNTPMSPNSMLTTEDINLPSEFSQSPKKGFSFGASREVYKRVYTKTQPFIQDPEMPGPGSYDVKSFVEKTCNDNRSFILGKKENHELPFNFPANPGPGYYNDLNNISKTGIYYNSKYHNSGSQKFAKKPREFLRISNFHCHSQILENNTPGPGQYDPKTLINRDGKYFVSTYRNSYVRKFGTGSQNNPEGVSNALRSLNYSVDMSTMQRSKMASTFKQHTPGPGSYRIMSEFGKYELNTVSPGAIMDTTATTPVKRSFSAMGQSRKKRTQSSMGYNVDDDFTRDQD
ncbi:UNKNOWN [Stylonychia lemnae]|uniref:Uncharacterized protein n=1 Tax=Stylonychia lemnae TaxID=5949 RepID=A0A078A0W2_STYLE|nr:UNKNOWN [Stylonychia lemnae]|eukprot:CDW75502.1 UNKNOWN [Stylonychia lemnae]